MVAEKHAQVKTAVWQRVHLQQQKIPQGIWSVIAHEIQPEYSKYQPAQSSEHSIIGQYKLFLGKSKQKSLAEHN